MSRFKTNTKRGDARERTKNLENITIMANINKNLNLNTTFKTQITNFKDNKLTSTNNHESLLKITKGYFNLEPCCLLNKNKAFSLEDGLFTNINTNEKTIIANSLCNRAPLYNNTNCEMHIQRNMNEKKDNFSFPIPIKKNECCSETKPEPKLDFKLNQNHVKFLPVMSKIKKYQYRTSDQNDLVKYPNYEIVNKNNLIGFFNDNSYAIDPCNTCNDMSNSNETTREGHKTKYSIQTTKCNCSDDNDYLLNTQTSQQTTQQQIQQTSQQQIQQAPSSFFSRKWTYNTNC